MKNLRIFNEYIKEQSNNFDPYGEDGWDDNDEKIIGYFICDRHRAFLNDNYAKDFLKIEKPKIYKEFCGVVKDFRRGFFDDSDAGIYKIYKNGDVKRIKGYSCN